MGQECVDGRSIIQLRRENYGRVYYDSISYSSTCLFVYLFIDEIVSGEEVGYRWP